MVPGWGAGGVAVSDLDRVEACRDAACDVVGGVVADHPAVVEGCAGAGRCEFEDSAVGFADADCLRNAGVVDGVGDLRVLEFPVLLDGAAVRHHRDAPAGCAQFGQSVEHGLLHPGEQRMFLVVRRHQLVHRSRKPEPFPRQLEQLRPRPEPTVVMSNQPLNGGLPQPIQLRPPPPPLQERPIPINKRVIQIKTNQPRHPLHTPTLTRPEPPAHHNRSRVAYASVHPLAASNCDGLDVHSVTRAAAPARGRFPEHSRQHVQDSFRKPAHEPTAGATPGRRTRTSKPSRARAGKHALLVVSGVSLPRQPQSPRSGGGSDVDAVFV